MKACAGHAGNSGGQSDEGADNGEHSGNDDCEITPADEEAVGPVQFAATHQDPAAIFFHQRAAPVTADLVSDQRSKVASDGSGGGCPEQFHCALVHQVAGEWHDQFGGRRNAGGFNGHQDGEAAVSGGGDYGFDEAKKNGENVFSHGVGLNFG